MCSGAGQRFSPDRSLDLDDMHNVLNLLEPQRAEEKLKGLGFKAPLKRQQWLGSPFKNTSRAAISRTCFVAGRLLI